MRRLTFYALLALALYPSLLFGATVGRVGAGGTVVFVQLTPAESKEFEVGARVGIAAETGDYTGMILSKKDGRARIKLDQPAEGLTPKSTMTLTLLGPDGEAPPSKTAAPTGAFPAAAALGLVRAPVSPWYSFADTAGRSNADGSSAEIFTTNPFVLSNTHIQYLFLFGSFQVGPDLAYFSTTNKITNNSKTEGVEPTQTTVQIKYSLLEVGVVGKYMFVPYAPQKVVPSFGLGFGIGQYARTIGEKDPQKASTQTLRVLLGLQYFLTSSIAFDAGIEYRSDTIRFTETESVTAGETTAKKSEDITQAISTTGINYGLAFYF